MDDYTLPLSRYRLTFIAQDTLKLPEFSGSAWRGVFGHALKDAVCMVNQKQCDTCLLKQSCIYTYIFETPPPKSATMMRRYPHAPHPYIIDASAQQSQQVKKGESLSIEVSLVGKANQYLAYIIHAFAQSGERGIGYQRGRFSLSHVEQWHDQKWMGIHQSGQALEALPCNLIEGSQPVKGKANIEFISPFRYRSNERYTTPENFTFYQLLGPLLRRLSALRLFHTDTPLDVDFAGLTQKAKAVRLEKNTLRLYDLKRYSSRQSRHVKMDGVTGSFQLNEADTKTFWPLLALGEHIHVGKGCAMGMGKYRLCAD